MYTLGLDCGTPCSWSLKTEQNSWQLPTGLEALHRSSLKDWLLTENA